MAEEQEEQSEPGILGRINQLLNLMRYLLVFWNLLAIIFGLYFAISGRNLGGEPLQMPAGARYPFTVLIWLTAIYGIVVAVWFGRKTKLHIKMIFVYLGVIIFNILVGIILAACFVRKTDSYDVVFIVLTSILVLFTLATGWSLSYFLRKTKMLRPFIRFNLF